MTRPHVPGDQARIVQVNVMMSQSERDLLTDLTGVERASAGAVVRAAVRARHSMVCCGVPLCAQGGRCLVPHLHPPASPSPKTEPKG